MQSVVVFYGLAWVYQLAQLKIDVTREMEVEITGGAANVGVYKLTSGVAPVKNDVAAEAEIGIGL